MSNNTAKSPPTPEQHHQPAPPATPTIHSSRSSIKLSNFNPKLAWCCGRLFLYSSAPFFL